MGRLRPFGRRKKRKSAAALLNDFQLHHFFLYAPFICLSAVLRLFSATRKMAKPIMFVTMIKPEILAANSRRLSTWTIGTIESETKSRVIKNPESAVNFTQTGRVSF